MQKEKKPFLIWTSLRLKIHTWWRDSTCPALALSRHPHRAIYFFLKKPFSSYPCFTIVDKAKAPFFPEFILVSGLMLSEAFFTFFTKKLSLLFSYKKSWCTQTFFLSKWTLIQEWYYGLKASSSKKSYKVQQHWCDGASILFLAGLNKKERVTFILLKKEKNPTA